MKVSWAHMRLKLSSTLNMIMKSSHQNAYYVRMILNSWTTSKGLLRLRQSLHLGHYWYRFTNFKNSNYVKVGTLKGIKNSFLLYGCQPPAPGTPLWSSTYLAVFWNWINKSWNLKKPTLTKSVYPVHLFTSLPTIWTTQQSSWGLY